MYAVLAVAFGYTLLRAWLVPVFHDEAATVVYFCGLPYDRILDRHHPNNHFFNTVLIKVCIRLWGMSEIIIRIPALIGHVLYLVGIYKICRLVARREVMVGGCVLLTLNPFMLELFSAARGYALSLGFFSLATYFLLGRLQSKSLADAKRCILWAVMLMSLSAVSHFSFFQIYASFLVLIFAIDRFYVHRPSPLQLSWRDWSVILFISLAIVAVFCVYPVYRIRKVASDQNLYVQNESFWNGTVAGLIQDILYGQYSHFSQAGLLVKYFVGIFAALACILVIKEILHRAQGLLVKCLEVMGVWLIGTVCLMFLQFELFGFQYVTGRLAVFFIPMFMFIVVLVWSLSANIKRSLNRRLAQAGFWLLTLLVLMHFFWSADLKYVHNCPYTADTREMLQDIKAIRLEQGKTLERTALATHWMFSPVINFYIMKEQLAWLRILPYRPSVQGDEEYFYFFSAESPYVQSEPDLQADIRNLGSLDVSIVKEYETTKTYLARINK